MPLTALLRLSYRNLLRHGRRNGILLTSICVAIAGVIFLNALLRGMQLDLERAARENLVGDFQVTAPGYLEDPQASHGFILAQEQIWQLNEHWPGGWTARLSVPAVVTSERENRGVTLVGIDPLQDSQSFLARAGIDGEPVADVEAKGLLVGKALLEELQTAPGKRVVIIGLDSAGRSRESGLKISGAYDADGTALEKQFAFMGRSALQALMGTDMGIGQVTEVSIMFPEPRTAESARPTVVQIFPNLVVSHWRERNAQSAAMFDMMDLTSHIWFVIVMFALGFGLVNALVTAVMERRREFGILRCVGMRPSAVLVQVLIESLLIMLLGVAAGILLGFAGVALTGGSIDLGMYAKGMEIAGFSSAISLSIEWGDVVNVAGLSAVFGILASLIPAWRANRIGALQAVAR